MIARVGGGAPAKQSTPAPEASKTDEAPAAEQGSAEAQDAGLTLTLTLRPTAGEPTFVGEPA